MSDTYIISTVRENGVGDIIFHAMKQEGGKWDTAFNSKDKEAVREYIRKAKVGE